MPLYNVAVPVVEVVQAADEQDAIRMLSTSLRKHGYEVYEGELPEGAHAFESETDATDEAWRHTRATRPGQKKGYW